MGEPRFIPYSSTQLFTEVGKPDLGRAPKISRLSGTTLNSLLAKFHVASCMKWSLLTRERWTRKVHLSFCVNFFLLERNFLWAISHLISVLMPRVLRPDEPFRPNRCGRQRMLGHTQGHLIEPQKGGRKPKLGKGSLLLFLSRIVCPDGNQGFGVGECPPH